MALETPGRWTHRPSGPAPRPPARTTTDLIGLVRGLPGRLDAATPADRDRAIDGLRALAIAGVVTGHWLVMALVLRPDGALRVTSPLVHLPAVAPLSWLLQMLGLFFLVGGYSAARRLDGGRDRTAGLYPPEHRRWVRARLLRLGRPVVAVTALLGAALPVLAAAGVPSGTLRTAVVLLVQPLWFIGVYAAITALTPVALVLDERFGVRAALGAGLVVAALDLLRYGPWREAMPGWIALGCVLPGWAFAYLLGVSWSRGRITRRGARVLAGGGIVLLLGLVLWAGYPASVVGVPGSGRSNAHPPSLLVVALAAAQAGLAITLRAPLDRLLRRREGLWAAVALLNLNAMTIFCWHQIALAGLTAAALVPAPGGLPGLHDVPMGAGWAAWRIAWFPVYLLVLLGCVLAARRFEGPWTGVGRPVRITAALATLGLGCYAMAVT